MCIFLTDSPRRETREEEKANEEEKEEMVEGNETEKEKLKDSRRKWKCLNIDCAQEKTKQNAVLLKITDFN